MRRVLQERSAVALVEQVVAREHIEDPVPIHPANLP
jgi:hypothetical protein